MRQTWTARSITLGMCIVPIWVRLMPARANAQIEDRPFKTLHVFPKITHGPLLLRPTEHSITVMWTTDIPCQAAVEYGEEHLDREVEPEHDGLIPVSTVHVIELPQLTPGHIYEYKVISTPVLKLKPYWPDKGQPLESGPYRFTTFDRNKSAVSFSFITDTHEDLARLQTLLGMIDWKTTDFLIRGGDPLNFVDSEDQMFAKWIDPTATILKQAKPFLYVRGNHDLRGPFARDVIHYMEPFGEHFYYATEDGPVYLLNVDTGEDKADSTNVYARLNEMLPYRAREFYWLQDTFENDSDLANAPFRVIVMHQPDWGWLNGDNHQWTALANRGKVDLIIAGHLHHLAYIKPGAEDNNYPILVVGQDQLATVTATPQVLQVTVRDKTGRVLLASSIPRRIAK